MKRILFLFITLFLTLAASAQGWLDNIPETYQPKCTQEVTSETSACNQGEEPFSTFLRKFNMSSRYRESRAKVTDNTPVYQNDLETLKGTVAAIKDFHVLPLRAVKGNSRMSTWFNVSADMVCYYSSVGCIMCFERIDGIWYVTAVMVAG